MKVLHGTWIPNTEADFIQTGAFYLWVETPVSKKRSGKERLLHPNHLAKDDLSAFLVQELGIKEASQGQVSDRISPKYFVPTVSNQPLPSPELTKYLEVEVLEDYEAFQYWEINCYEVTTVVKNGYNSQRVIADLCGWF